VTPNLPVPRNVAEYVRALTQEPDLLLRAETNPSESGPARNIIRSWEQIPDVMSIASLRTEWIVDGIIPRSSVTLIAGEPGSYKSWLALALLRAVTTGGRFLNRESKRADVLYLDRENPVAVVRERLAILGIESLGSSRIWGGWLPDSPPLIGDVRLVQMARERRPVLIIDSFIRFHSADENSASDMAPVMNDLRILANEGATIVALHHKSKTEGSNYRGSSDIAGGVDTAFSVSRDRQSGILRFACFKSRFVEEFSVSLRPDLAGVGEFVVTDAPAASAAHDAAERLAQAIRNRPGQTQRELLAVCGLPNGKARATLAQGDGQLWRSQTGPHNAKLFFPLETAGTVEIEV